MLILVHTAHPQALLHKGDGFGRLLSPRQFSRVRDTAADGIPWAADNDCFQGLDEVRFRAMVATIEGVPGCKFLVAPDRVGDWIATAKMFDWWYEYGGLRDCGQPLAFVLQDGMPTNMIPWGRIRCVFVGGNTSYKLSAEAEDSVRAAKMRGLWVHMGRVNSRRRFDYARAIGCDSIDGTKFSRWRNTWLPDALRWHKEPYQGRLECASSID